MAEERKERCVGCGRILGFDEKVVYVWRLVVSVGTVSDIKMWVNHTQRNLAPEENAFLCNPKDHPECGPRFFKKLLLKNCWPE